MAIGVQIPQVGDSPSQYVEKIKNSFESIDSHDHADDPVRRLDASAVDNSTLELSGGKIQVKNGGVTQAKLAPSFGGLVPTGTILPFAANITTPPTGYLLCDGSSHSVTTFPALAAKLGTRIGGDGVNTFNVPDLRGQFLRGIDTGTSVDPDSASRTYNGGSGNLIGSFQTDQFQSHNHTAAFPTVVGFGAGDTAGFGPNAANPTNQNFTLQNQNSITESRPKNVYVEFIIKT